MWSSDTIFLMKNNIPLAIIFGAIIIALAVYFSSLNDPLSKCMDKLIAKGYASAYAAQKCSGG